MPRPARDLGQHPHGRRACTPTEAMPPARSLHPRALALETRLRGLEVLGREDERLDAWLDVSLQRAHPRLARGGTGLTRSQGHTIQGHTPLTVMWTLII